MQQECRALYRKRREKLEQVQSIRANRILSMGSEIFVEQMDWKDMSEDKALKVAHSITIRAPGQQIEILRRKLSYTGRDIHLVEKSGGKSGNFVF